MFDEKLPEQLHSAGTQADTDGQLRSSTSSVRVASVWFGGPTLSISRALKILNVKGSPIARRLHALLGRFIKQLHIPKMLSDRLTQKN